MYCLLWLFLAHFCACIWWAIGVADFNVQVTANAAHSLFICCLKPTAIVTTSVCAACTGGNCIKEATLESENRFRRPICDVGFFFRGSVLLVFLLVCDGASQGETHVLS